MNVRACTTCQWWTTKPASWPDGVARSGICTMIRGEDDRWSVVPAQIVKKTGGDAPETMLVTGRHFFCSAWKAAS